MNLDIYGQTMVNTRHGFESFPITTYHNLISGIKGNATDAPWANRVDLPSTPVDINADGKVDFCFAREVYKPGTYSLGHGHGFMTWTPTGWVDRADWALPFSTQNNVSYHRFNHFQFSDLDGDGFQDAVVHMNTGSLMSDPNGADGNAGSVISTTGTAWLNRIGSGGTWEQSTSFVLPKPLKVSGVSGELGRRLFDANADGLPDFIQSRSVEAKEVYLNNGRGFDTQPAPSKYNLPIYLTNGNGDDVGSRLVDLNGDGLVDAIKDLAYGGVHYPTAVYLNTGDGWQKVADGVDGPIEPDCWNLPDLTFSTFDKYEEDHTGQSSMVDVNADGLMDIVVARFMPGDTGFNNFVYLNSGTGWWRSDTAAFWADGTTGSNLNKFAVPVGHPIYRTPTAATNGKAVGTFADINGDGAADYISDMDTPMPRVWINQCGPELIEAVTDGFGARLEVEYTNLNDPTPQGPASKSTYTPFSGTLPTGHVAAIHGGKVVTRLRESDGVGGVRATCRYYGDLRFDRNNEASLGFGWFEVHDEQFPATGGYLNYGYTRTENRRDYPFSGSPAIVRTYVHVPNPPAGQPAMAHQPDVSAGTKLISEEITDYGQILTGIAPIAKNAGGTTKRPVQTYSQIKKWELNGTLMSRTTTLQPAANYNEYGFLTSSSVSALDGSTTSTTNVYQGVSADAERWYLGRLSASTVVKTPPPESGPATVTKSTAFTYNPITGLLESETVEPGDALSVTKSYTHDPFGNVRNTVVTASGQTRSSITVFDGMGRFPIRESTVGLGTVFHAYDFERAQLDSTCDLDGRITGFSYDAFGTRLTTDFPNGTRSAEITRDFETAPPSLASVVWQQLSAVGDIPAADIRWARTAETSGAPPITVYFDKLGREVLKESVVYRGSLEGFATQFSVTRYDVRGRKCLVSQPFLVSDPAVYWTAITHDFLNRPIKTQRPDGTSEEVLEIQGQANGGTHPQLYTKMRNAKGNALERWEDQHKRLVRSSDPSGQTTSFQHDVEGRVIEVKIGGIVQLTNTYHPKFGYKTAIDDRSSGVTTSSYNGFGEVVSTTSWMGATGTQPLTTTTTYDHLGRVHSVAKPEGTFVTSYRPTSPAKGKPASVSGPGGYLETYAYGSNPWDYGLLIKASKRQSVSQQELSSTTAYNALGLVWKEVDAGGAEVTREYVSGSFELRTTLTAPKMAHLSEVRSITSVTLDKDSDGLNVLPAIRTTELLAHGVLRDTYKDARNGRLLRIFSSALETGLQDPLQDLWYNYDLNGNLTVREDLVAGKSETFQYDTDGKGLDRLGSSTVAGQSPVNYTYDDNGNLRSKGNTSLSYYDSNTSFRVETAKVKGSLTNNRAYTYDAAGHVTADGKRTYVWTSFGQLAEVYQESAPGIETFAATGSYNPHIPGIASSQHYATSSAQSNFEFDASGQRVLQSLVRTYSDSSAARVITRYLGDYETEEHATKSTTGEFAAVKTIHRHNLRGTVLTDEVAGTASPGDSGSTIRLAVILADHLGSTDVVVRADWDSSSLSWKTATTQPKAERQSFDAWGDRRNSSNWAELRPADSSPRVTSTMDYDRGFTGHEMLDDFGLVHMNGRIYDPEIGRFLSPDPYVQVPEYSQSFNRYTYVLNNPLSLTDPSGHSWVGDNWLSIVVMVVVAIISWGVGTALVGAGNAALATAGAATGGSVAAGTTLTTFTVASATAAGGVGLNAAGMALSGAIAGFAGGGLNAAVNGGDAGDILRGALVGSIQGGVSGGLLHGLADGAGFDSALLHTAGHGVVGGGSNAALGGRFQDGFLSGAAGAVLARSGVMGKVNTGSDFGDLLGRTAIAGVAGGTVSALGGGKFANGAWTAAFQHILNSEGDVVKEKLTTAIFYDGGDPGGKAGSISFMNKDDFESVARGTGMERVIDTRSSDDIIKYVNQLKKDGFKLKSWILLDHGTPGVQRMGGSEISIAALQALASVTGKRNVGMFMGCSVASGRLGAKYMEMSSKLMPNVNLRAFTTDLTYDGRYYWYKDAERVTYRNGVETGREAGPFKFDKYKPGK